MSHKEIMRQAGFGKEVEMIEHGFCPLCKTPVSNGEFRDEMSRREYKISGLCQKCQDEIFGG